MDVKPTETKGQLRGRESKKRQSSKRNGNRKSDKGSDESLFTAGRKEYTT